MKKRIVISVISVLLAAVSTAQEFDFTVNFYGTPVTLRADSGMLCGDPRLSATADNISRYYHSMVIAPADPFLASIKKQRKKLGLNDWLTFDLMQQSADALFPNASQNLKTLFLWYLCSETGWDVELYLAGHNASLLVRTKETIYERDFYKKDDIYFVKIYPDEKPRGQDFKYQRFIPPFDNSTAQPFSFLMDSVPGLAEKPDTIDYTFYHDEKKYSVRLKINENAVSLFNHYPVVSQEFYFMASLSRLARREVVRAMGEYLKGRNTLEGLTFLLSFVRTAFVYESDAAQFGREIPYTAEQALFYPRSDCEDRSALFFQLVKIFYPDIPMIVLEYPEHVNVAVALPEAHSLYPVPYKDRRYYVCEPTNPGNELKLGQNQFVWDSYKIIYDYEPPVKKIKTGSTR